jgi:hypothetical protein
MKIKKLLPDQSYHVFYTGSSHIRNLDGKEIDALPWAEKKRIEKAMGIDLDGGQIFYWGGFKPLQTGWQCL